MLHKLTMGIMLLFVNVLSAGTIHVAVAANVAYAIEDLIHIFNISHPNTKVIVTLGSSGKLVAQIKQGAPYQVFMSADMSYPKSLYDEGLASREALVYAQGSLVMFSKKEQDFSKGIALVKDLNFRKIAIANPKTAPYGKASVEAMKNSNLFNDVKARLIYGESIAQTISFIMIAADIGFVAKSSLFSPKMAHFKQGVHWVEVNPKLYAPINQGMVLLKNADKNTEVLAFYDFMTSAKAKMILNDFGYEVP